MALLPLLCRKIWVWPLSTLGPCSGDAVAVGHSGELEGVSIGQWAQVGPLSPPGLGIPRELGALGAHTQQAALWGRGCWLVGPLSRSGERFKHTESQALVPGVTIGIRAVARGGELAVTRPCCCVVPA